MDKLKHMDICRYNLSGELLGIQNVTDWTNEDVKAFVIAIQKRGDGSYAALKERSEGQNEARVDGKTKRTKKRVQLKI